MPDEWPINASGVRYVPSLPVSIRRKNSAVKLLPLQEILLFLKDGKLNKFVGKYTFFMDVPWIQIPRKTGCRKLFPTSKPWEISRDYTPGKFPTDKN